MPAPTPHVLLVSFNAAEVGAEIPYLFKKAGAHVTVFCNKNSWLLKNRYWDAWVLTAAPDALVNPSHLQRHLADHAYDRVILVDEGTLVDANDAITDDATAQKIFSLTDVKRRYIVGSKAGFARLCEEIGLLSPPSIVCNGSDVTPEIVHHISYPLLVKTDIGCGGRGVFKCENFQDIQSIFQKLTPAQKTNLVFQKFIPGSDVFVEALFNNGVPLAYVSSRGVSTVSGEFAASREREYFYSPQLEKEVHATGLALGINGIASLTYRHSSSDGRYFLIESDLRANVWFKLAEHVGVDFSQAIRAWLEGRNLFIRPHLTESEQFTMRFFQRDVINCFQRGDMAGIFAWIFNVQNRWKFIPWYDKKLFVATLGKVLYLCIGTTKGAIRKKLSRS